MVHILVGALQHTDLEEQLIGITQELSEIKANQHTSLTELSDQVQEIRDNSKIHVHAISESDSFNTYIYRCTQAYKLRRTMERNRSRAVTN